jgi:predicted PurR-regulated permease PerM
MPPERPDQLDARVIDLVIRLILLGLFAYFSLTLVRPFLPILISAAVLAVALAPLHIWLSRILGARRRLAAVLVTCLMLVLVIGPVAALAENLVDSVQIFVARMHDGALDLPQPPAGLAGLPVVGEQLTALWAQAASNLDVFLASYRKVLTPIAGGLLGLVSSLGLDIVKFVLSIILAGGLLVPGPRLGDWGRRIVSRIISPQGEEFVNLATVTIRNVSRGVVGVALFQSVLIGFTLLAFAVPGAGPLTFVILILSILQIGPALVVLPVLIWAWMGMDSGHALALTLLLLPLTLMDNVLKPLLMGRGLKTPTLVIFLGLIGGTLSYGLIGLFLGPVVLAVFHDLIVNWLRAGKALGVDDA